MACMIHSEHPEALSLQEKVLHSPVSMDQKQMGTCNRLDPTVNLGWVVLKCAVLRGIGSCFHNLSS